MKRTIQTAIVCTALLAGTMISSAQPDQQDRRPRRKQNLQQFERNQSNAGRRQHVNACPRCGQHPHRANRNKQVGRTARQNEGVARQNGRQWQTERQTRQQARGENALSNERSQRKELRQQRKARLQRFDTDGDGILSTEERQVAREAKKGDAARATR